MAYLKARREQLGGSLPARNPTKEKLAIPAIDDKVYARQLKSEGAMASTTQAFSAILQNLMKNKAIGERIVPIIPDEARTFGFEEQVRQRRDLLEQGPAVRAGRQGARRRLPEHDVYKETTDGQILEEGINEAGAMGPSWRPAPRMPTSASRWSRSTPTTRCSASSASAT